VSNIDSFKSRKTLTVNGKDYVYYSLTEAEKNGLTGISKLPFSIKVLLENLLRFEDDRSVKKSDIEALPHGSQIADRQVQKLLTARHACSCRISPAFQPLLTLQPCAMA